MPFHLIFNQKIIARGLFRVFLSLLLLEGILRFGGFVFVSYQAYLNNSKSNDTYRILCIGESITALGGKYSWPNQLEETLNELSLNKKYKIINVGRPGITSGYINDHLNDHLDLYQPDMVVALVGATDYFYKDTVPDNAFTKLKFLVLDKFLIYKLIKKIKQQIESGIEDAYKRRLKKKPVSESNNPDADAVVEVYHQIYSNQLKGSVFEHNRCSRIKYTSLAKTPTDLIPLFKNAQKEYQEELKAKPNDTGLQLDLSICAFELKEYPTVINLLERNDILQKVVWAYQPLARSYVALGDYKKAEATLLKNIEADSTNYWPVIDLSDIYILQKKFPQAIELYQKAIERNSKIDRLYFELADIYKQLNELSKANKYRALGEVVSAYHPLTIRNYNDIVKKVLDRNIKLVCMQYPLRRVSLLKKMLSNNKDIVFTSNEDSFYKAIRNISSYEILVDFAIMDTGHNTSLGNHLIAKNLAKIILEQTK